MESIQMKAFTWLCFDGLRPGGFFGRFAICPHTICIFTRQVFLSQAVAIETHNTAYKLYDYIYISAYINYISTVYQLYINYIYITY